MVHGTHDFTSEFVQGIHDLDNQSLIGEVLLDGKSNQSFNHGAGSHLVPGLLLDLAEGLLDFFDLNQACGRVGEAVK